ncbi:MAG TPA: hypothetical protein VLL52_14970 [Anaerolineae bacterium]|nr:hypothetical protein [Anaerolineae bacterium]
MNLKRQLNHQRLMAKHWPNAAAIAWKAYNDDGRCALIMRPDEVELSLQGEVAYLDDPHMQAQAPADLLDILQTYKPDEEVIFIIDDGDLISYYSLASQPAPPDAGEYYEVVLL